MLVNKIVIQSWIDNMVLFVPTNEHQLKQDLKYYKKEIFNIGDTNVLEAWYSDVETLLKQHIKYADTSWKKGLISVYLQKPFETIDNKINWLY